MVAGRFLKSVTAGAIALGLGVTLAYASADDTIKARQACMKAHGASMGVIVPMFKGEKPYDNAPIQAAFAKEEAACADWSSSGAPTP